MTDVVLVLNAGSSSIKFSMFAVDASGKDLGLRFCGQIEGIGSSDPRFFSAAADGRRVVAIVTEQGSRTAHAAIVSRELGLPCIVGTGIATQVLKSDHAVTRCCAEGPERRVYCSISPGADPVGAGTRGIRQDHGQ